MEIYKKSIYDYEISNFGNCRRLLKSGEYIKVNGSIGNAGYRYLQINRSEGRKNYLFHHLVSECFLGKRPPNLVVDHIDRNKLNNNVLNLRYVTHKENLQNQDRFKSEIKETGNERLNILARNRRSEIRNERTFICETCPLVSNVKGIFSSIRDYNVHNESTNHKKRILFINEMKKHNIEINKKQYKSLLDKIDSYNGGKTNIRPLIYISNKQKKFKTIICESCRLVPGLRYEYTTNKAFKYHVNSKRHKKYLNYNK